MCEIFGHQNWNQDIRFLPRLDVSQMIQCLYLDDIRAVWGVERGLPMFEGGLLRFSKF